MIPTTGASCAACGSYLATTGRYGAAVCHGCAHMIDFHGARLHDASAPDPCLPTSHQTEV